MAQRLTNGALLWHTLSLQPLTLFCCTHAGAFVICWTPGLVILLLDGLLGKATNANIYEKFCLVVAECNCMINPIIYTLRDNEMRRTFKWILCCLCRRNACAPGRLSAVELASTQPKVECSWGVCQKGLFTAVRPSNYLKSVLIVSLILSSHLLSVSHCSSY